MLSTRLEQSLVVEIDAYLLSAENLKERTYGIRKNNYSLD